MDLKIQVKIRPIALILNIAKIFIQITFSKLYNFVTKGKIFSDKQYGFGSKKAKVLMML